MSKLLLLDITGVLCRKLKREEAPLDALHLEYYSVAPRALYKEFLLFCYTKYKVGFFSSTTHTNANPILNLLLTEEQRRDTTLFWFRDRTRFDPEASDFETVKVLNDLFENPTYNRLRLWNETNTLIVDDSPSKIRLNKSENVLIVPTDTGDPNDTALIELLIKIQERFD